METEQEAKQDRLAIWNRAMAARAAMEGLINDKRLPTVDEWLRVCGEYRDAIAEYIAASATTK